jgi:hypothetical protein
MIPEFPENREINREFAKSAGAPGTIAADCWEFKARAAKIPLRRNREFAATEQGTSPDLAGKLYAHGHALAPH